MLFARMLIGNISSWDQIKFFFIKSRWLEDKRKTKVGTEERSVQDYAIRVFKGLQCMTTRADTEEVWRNWGRSFGEAMGNLLRVLEMV